MREGKLGRDRLAGRAGKTALADEEAIRPARRGCPPRLTDSATLWLISPPPADEGVGKSLVQRVALLRIPPARAAPDHADDARRSLAAIMHPPRAARELLG